MKKIYLCYSGVNKKYIEDIYHVSSLELSKDKIAGYCYYTIEDGDSSVIEVVNYQEKILYTVGVGETAFDIISQGYSVDADIESGDVVILSKDNRVRHIVRPLDTIDSIAAKYGVTVEDIMLSNSLNSSRLYIGQMLYV